MQKQGIVLYDYWRSSSAYRVRIGLALLGIEYRRHPIDLTAGLQRSEDNLKRNPQGVVPTLEIDGLILTQSLAILEYLNETREAGFLPKRPDERASVRALAMAIAMEIQPVCNLRVARHVMDISGGAVDQANWMRHFIGSGLIGFEAMLSSGVTQYCHGNSVTIADICLVPQVYNARRWGVSLEQMPLLTRIDSHLRSLPAFASAAPDVI